MLSSDYNLLVVKLDEFIRKYYKNLFIRGSIYSVALVVVSFLLVVMLEYFGHFNTVTRTIIFYSFLFVSSYILVRFIAIPLLKLYRMGNTISYEQAAKIIGRHFGDVRDKLLNVLQLQQQLPQHQSPISNQQLSILLIAGINQKIAGLKPVPFSSAIDLSRNRKYLKYALPPVLLVILLSLISPDIIVDSTERLVRHTTPYNRMAPFQFVIENEHLKAIQLEDFPLNVHIEGSEILQDAFIEVDGNMFKMRKDKTMMFSHLFKNVQSNIAFRFFADEFYSRPFELVVLPAPVVLNFGVELSYPAYVGKQNEAFQNTGDLVVPAGTTIRWTFNTRNTEQLTLGFADSVYNVKSSGDNSFTWSERFLTTQPYFISTQNKFLKSKDSIHYAINVIPDMFPSVEVDERTDSLAPKQIFFHGAVKDDYGFKKLVFNYRFVFHAGSPEDTLKKTSDNDLPARTALSDLYSDPLAINSSSTQQHFYHYWDMGKLSIKAGDEIEYYFEVWDNDQVNGSKSSTSQKKIFKAPTLKELAEKQEQANSTLKSELKQSMSEAKQLQQELKKLSEKLAEKKSLAWEDKKRAKELLDKHKELEKKLDQIKQGHSETIRRQSEYTQPNEALLEKQRQIQELFEKVMTDEMKKLYEELYENLDKMDKNKLQEMMEKLKLSDKDIEKELDRTLELFKQLEFDKKLQEATEKLDEMKQKQDQLAEETKQKNADPDLMKDKQDVLNEEFENFRKQLDELQKKNAELEFPKDMKNTDPQEESIQKEMNQSKEQLKQKNKNKSVQNQKNASNQMQQLSDEMKEMQSDMQSEQEEEDQAAMRQLLENLVSLSFEQEELMNRSKQTDRSDPKYVKLGQDQKKLKDDAKMIEDSLFALSKRVAQIAPVVNREMSAVNENMDRSLSHLTERNIPLAATRQQQAMTSINNLALLFDEINQQMQQQKSNSKPGSSGCKKPGNSKASPSNLKKMQDALNKQIQKLKDEMGKEPGPGKKQSKNQGMSQQLMMMAAEQEAIRMELQKMSKEMGGEQVGEGKKKLDELSKLMEETETDLVNRRITQETIKRQQDILIRLLESEKADREREFDEKRESKEVTNEQKRNPSEFFEYNKLKEKEIELLRTIPPSLNMFYKNKVNEYFNQFEE